MRKSDSAWHVPGVGEGSRGAQGHLGYLLRQANVAFRARLERALGDTGVTQPQFAVMTMIAAYPGCSSADIARLSLLTPPTVTVIVSNLKRDGLLLATAHPVHGRVRRLELTERGGTVLKHCKAVVQELEDELTSALSPDQETTIRRWLVDVAVQGQADDERESGGA